MRFFKFQTGHKAQANENMLAELSNESYAICSLLGRGKVSGRSIAAGSSQVGAIVAAMYAVKCTKE